MKTVSIFFFILLITFMTKLSFGVIRKEIKLSDLKADFNDQIFLSKNPIMLKTLDELLKEFLWKDPNLIFLNLKNDIDTWNKNERFSKDWSLQSTGCYYIGSEERKKEHVEKQIRKYLDKRLVYEMRKSKKGTPLYYAGQVEQSINIKNEMKVSKKIKFKINLKGFEQKGSIKLTGGIVDGNVEFLDVFRGSRTMIASIEKKFLHETVRTKIAYFSRYKMWDIHYYYDLYRFLTLKFTATQGVKNVPWDKNSEKIFGFVLYPNLIFKELR